jgi:hypothetical protein
LFFLLPAFDADAVPRILAATAPLRAEWEEQLARL